MKEFVKKLIYRLEEELANVNFEKATKEVNGSFYDGLAYAYGYSVGIALKLAEEYKGGWISVDDRLPEENGKYIVYYHKWSDGNYLPKFDGTEIRILRYRNNGWIFPTYGDTEAEKDSHREVIGWMPLPEPYTQKGVINGTE